MNMRIERIRKGIKARDKRHAEGQKEKCWDVKKRNVCGGCLNKLTLLPKKESRAGLDFYFLQGAHALPKNIGMH